MRPPWLPAPRPDVHHIIGGEDGILVMFHDDHRIAEIAQALQRLQQARIVALVQAMEGSSST